MDLDSNPDDSGSIGSGRDHDQPPESQELTDLKTFIEAGLDGLDKSISQQFASLSQQIQVLTNGAENSQGRSNVNITSASMVNIAFESEIVVMLMAFGGMLGFPKSTWETTRLGVTRGHEHRFK